MDGVYLKVEEKMYTKPRLEIWNLEKTVADFVSVVLRDMREMSLLHNTGAGLEHESRDS